MNNKTTMRVNLIACCTQELLLCSHNQYSLQHEIYGWLSFLNVVRLGFRFKNTLTVSGRYMSFEYLAPCNKTNLPIAWKCFLSILESDEDCRFA